MNALDLLVTAALLLAWAVVLMPILGFMRLRRLERRLIRLQDLTYTFTDASSRLSKALEQTIIDPHSGLVRSSRRDGRWCTMRATTRSTGESGSIDRQAGITSRRIEPDGYRASCRNGACFRARDRRGGLTRAPDRSVPDSASNSVCASDSDPRTHCARPIAQDASATGATADRNASGSRSRPVRA